MVEREQLITPTDIGIADVDLWNSATRCFFHHLGAPCRIKVDTHFFDFGDTSCVQQLLCPRTEGTNRRRVHHHTRRNAHFFAPFLSGSPAVRQALIPPSRQWTFAKPRFASCLLAVLERDPDWQIKSSGPSLNLSSSPARSCSLPAGIFLDSGKCPEMYSSGSRKSVSYTHLDVYQRQLLACPQRDAVSGAEGTRQCRAQGTRGNDGEIQTY